MFSCFNQDQELDRVDFDDLRAALNQNGVPEKLTGLWVDRWLRRLGLRRRGGVARARHAARLPRSREREYSPACPTPSHC